MEVPTPIAQILRFGVFELSTGGGAPRPCTAKFASTIKASNRGSGMSKLIVVILAAVSFAACSNGSPVTPSPSSAAPVALDARGAPAAPGVYDLSFNVFRNGVYEEVSSLPVSSRELILKAYITNSAGVPATAGSVTFEYCSYGGRKNDIENADEAPKEACSDGSAAWARLASISVTAGRCPTLGTGYACMNFGIVRIPRTVGFRIRYDAKGSGIAGATTEPENFTWVQ
jgi:hypothetical protein